MARREAKTGKKGNQEDAVREELLTKRCPECFVSLPLDAKACFSCNTRVGAPDRHGKARKQPDWVSYLICIVSWTVFFLYCEWAFFR